jgi:hypothetical protein
VPLEASAPVDLDSTRLQEAAEIVRLKQEVATEIARLKQESAAEITRLQNECEERRLKVAAAERALAESAKEIATLRESLDAESAGRHSAMEKVASLQHDAAAAATSTALKEAAAAADARRPFELRLGIIPAPANYLDVEMHKVHATIAGKKWGEHETMMKCCDAPCPLVRFDNRALALQKGLLSTVMAYVGAANLYESAMHLPLVSRRDGIRNARAAIKAAQKRLQSLVSMHKQLEQLLVEARVMGIANGDSDAYTRRACICRAAEIFVERFNAIGDLQHLAFECASISCSVTPVQCKWLWAECLALCHAPHLCFACRRLRVPFVIGFLLCASAGIASAR